MLGGNDTDLPMIDFDAHDTDLDNWPRDELNRATLAAQDPDHVDGVRPPMRDYGREPAEDWRTRHQYISDVYEDDLGAPSPDAYTADEKRSRARMRVWAWRIGFALLVGAVMWLVSWLPTWLVPGP